VLKGKGHGTAVDWWSLGTLLYEMLTGLPPFYSQNVGVMYQKVLNSELKFPAYISVSAKALLTGLLTRDPKRRLGNTEEDIRKHPWFKGINWDALIKKQVSAPFVPKVHGKDDVNMVPRCTLHAARCTLHAARCTLHAARCTLHAARFTLCLRLRLMR
jgi:serine/threonine protein kinase